MLPSLAYFQETQRLLTQRGIVVHKAHYRPESFGSWELYLAASPHLRFLFDGKDGWLFVQRLIPDPSGAHKWEDVWVENQPSSRTPAQAVDQLAQLLA